MRIEEERDSRTTTSWTGGTIKFLLAAGDVVEEKRDG